MKIIDLFCGAGGFSQGFKEAGHEVILAIDNWESALHTHEENHPETEHWMVDIRQVKSLPKCDVIIGGPPCQAFSYYGKERGSKDPRGQLLKDFLRLAQKAKYILFENVPGVERFRLYHDVITQLDLHAQQLSCADFGTPTIRRRIFASNFGFPVPSHSSYPFQQLFTDKKTKKWLSVQDELPFDDSSFFFLRRWTGGRNGPPIRAIHKPFWTVLGNGEFYVCRKFTIEEFALIQGFPHDYRFVGSDSQVYQQIANAVPPPVAKAFGDLLHNGRNRAS